MSSYKLIILAPSAGGKSTLMRYLREHTDLEVAETDEEVVKANGGDWPEPELYKSLVNYTAEEVFARDHVVYLMKDMPEEIVRKAKENGFKVIVLKIRHAQLLERNRKRVEEEGYEDAAQWFEGQLKELDRLGDEGLVDAYIDGELPTEQIAEQVVKLASN